MPERLVTRRQLLQTAPGLLLAGCLKRPKSNWDLNFDKPNEHGGGIYKLTLDGGFFPRNPYFRLNYVNGDFRLNIIVEPQELDLRIIAELGHPNSNTPLDGWSESIRNPNFNNFHMFMTRWSNWKFTEWGFDAARYSLPAPTQPPSRRSI